MVKRISSLPFHDTAEQAAKLDEVINGLKGQPGAVMPALHQAQDIYGYLPMEVQKKIADGLEVPMEEVYGVSTFYSQFSLTPKGRNHISVCLGTACYVKGSDKVLDRIVETLPGFFIIKRRELVKRGTEAFCTIIFAAKGLLFLRNRAKNIEKNEGA